MQIADFPRPPDDNGRGIHWSARIYHPTGADLDFWLDELQAMHMKWVKLLDDGDGSSLELCQRLLDAGIMPVVRLFREKPNPGRIGGRERSGLQKLIAIGVRYFETNNEPDLPAEWHTPMPENWLDVVTDSFIHDADVILSMGGLPAVPAMGPGGRENVIAKAVARGRRDLFENGAWLAIHNYTLNHPLNYPDDDVNQKGTPLTRAEFERFPAWSWDNRSLEMVNELRARAKNPGDTILDDPNCFRGWERWGKLMQDDLGFAIPVISTEGGPVVGWGDDKRYPKMTPEQQADFQIGITRFMQEQAPEWYFSCCTWLLASRPLGDWNPTWEQMSWYTDAWNERFGLAGRLPIVQRMKDLPPAVRPELQTGSASLRAQVLRGDTGAPLADVPVELEAVDPQGRAGRRRQLQTDADGRIELEKLSAGPYRLLVFNSEMSEFELAADDRKRLTVRVQAGARSRVFGQVQDANGQPQPGLPVSLHQQSPLRRLVEATTDSEGRFRFDGLAGGRVLVRVAPGTAQSTEMRGIVLDGWDAEEVNVSVPPAASLRYEIASQRLLPPGETGNRNLLFGQVLDKAGNPLDGATVRMRWTGAAPDTNFPTVKSGQDPFKPRGYFEFIHTAGVFSLDVVDGEIPSAVAQNLVTADMPARQRPISYEVVFRQTPTAQPGSRSSIGGRATGAPGELAVTLSGGNRPPQVTRLDGQGRFQFGNLPAGSYQVSLEGVGIIAEDVVMDGSRRVEIDFPMLGQIAGRVLPVSPPGTVVLTCETYSIRREVDSDPSGGYRFTGLPADAYRLRLDGAALPAQQVVCDGRTASDGPTFDREMGAQGIIRGSLTDHSGNPAAQTVLWLRSLGQRIAESQTDDAGKFRFSGLGAGRYSLEVIGQGIVAADIEIDGSGAEGQGEAVREIALPAPHRSVIQGRVLDADGATPVPNRRLLLTGPMTRRATSDGDGRFRLEGLAAGVYTLRVADTPETKRQISLELNETEEVRLRLPGGEEDNRQAIRHYLLIASGDRETARSQLSLAVDYVLRRGVTVGFSPDAALRAKRVTVIGEIPPEILQSLSGTGADVRRVSGDLAQMQAELEALP